MLPYIPCLLYILRLPDIPGFALHMCVSHPCSIRRPRQELIGHSFLSPPDSSSAALPLLIPVLSLFLYYKLLIVSSLLSFFAFLNSKKLFLTFICPRLLIFYLFREDNFLHPLRENRLIKWRMKSNYFFSSSFIALPHNT